VAALHRRGSAAIIAVTSGTVSRSLLRQSVSEVSTVLISTLESKSMSEIDNAHKPDVGLVGASGTGTMTDGELDFVAGGEPSGYHECVLGSVGGGGPGLYPSYVACRLK
jgi:hypothetical protein